MVKSRAGYGPRVKSIPFFASPYRINVYNYITLTVSLRRCNFYNFVQFLFLNGNRSIKLRLFSYAKLLFSLIFCAINKSWSKIPAKFVMQAGSRTTKKSRCLYRDSGHFQHVRYVFIPCFSIIGKCQNDLLKLTHECCFRLKLANSKIVTHHEADTPTTST